jgi:hypothetical protein
MARRFVRSWFSDKLEEVNDDSPGGRQIIAREPVRTGYDPRRSGKHGGAYSQGWNLEGLAVPIEQINEANEAAKRYAPGVTFVPTKDGGYCQPAGESRRSRNACLEWHGKVDFDGGYGDRTSSRPGGAY